MPHQELLRLTRIVVDGLFGIYNHDIHLNLDERVTLLHGPNGVGKTAVLGMTNSLLQESLDYFRPLPFARFSLSFHDGSSVDIAALPDGPLAERRYTLTLTRPDRSHSATVSGFSRAERVAARIDYLRPHWELPHTWVDKRDGELLRAPDVLSRFSDGPPTDPGDEDDISWLGHFLKNANAHFIEAQRLVRLNWAPLQRFPYMPMPPDHSIMSTVHDCSEHFKERLAETMVQYGRESQKLDQSFPQRLIEATEELPVRALQEQMSTLDRKTSDLKEIGILDETHPFSVASLDEIDPTQRRVMTLYVHDTAQKLRVLDDLATRAHVLLDNVNQKYRHKKIELDREHGFVAKSGGGQPLPLSSLSSGEQQELVLHYDLLFRVRSNTIVLIDEPELSLHVAWQKRFLPDLLQIVQLSNFDALVATHSPYVVGERTDLMVGLGKFQ